MLSLGPQAGHRPPPLKFAIEQNKRVLALPRIVGAGENEDEEDFLEQEEGVRCPALDFIMIQWLVLMAMPMINAIPILDRNKESRLKIMQQ